MSRDFFDCFKPGRRRAMLSIRSERMASARFGGPYVKASSFDQAKAIAMGVAGAAALIDFYWLNGLAERLIVGTLPLTAPNSLEVA